MRILYDARWILVENRSDGVSRYSSELARSLAAQPGITVDWLIDDLRQLKKLPKGDYLLANNPQTQPFAETFLLAHHINRAGYTHVYSPFFMMGTLGRRYKLIMTIHDLFYFTFKTPPQWLPWYTRLSWRLFYLTRLPMRWQLNRADAIATVSQTVAKELKRHTMTKRPIHVVSNAVASTFTDNASRQHWGSRRIVYMGAVTPYKNVECLIDALAQLPEEYTLALCGKIPSARMPELKHYIAERHLTKRVTLYDGATDKQYLNELSGALCSASASRAEGFGLPIIEAQQHGVPFVAADTPIFHEVAGNSALFFNPDNPHVAAQQIMRLTNKKTNTAYAARGLKNAQKFTWNNSAIAAVKTIRSL